VLSITVPTNLKLTDILATAATESQCINPCVAQILSVTDPTGKVTLCQNNMCPSITTTRRLLSSAGWVISLGFLSQIPLPPNPVISISQNTVATFNAPVSPSQAMQLLQNPAQMLTYAVPPQSTPPPPQSTASSSSSTIIIVVVVVVVVLVLVVCIICGVLYKKTKKQRTHIRRTQYTQVPTNVRIQRPVYPR
jgi:hypothetical protein